MNTESRLVEFINHTRLSDVPESAMITLRRVLLAVSGTGVAGTDHGVRLTVFDEIDGARNGRIFFAADAIDGAFGHFHDLRGVDDFHARIAAAVLVELRADAGFVTDKEKLFEFRKLAQGEDRAAHARLRGVVAAHGIERNFHRRGTRELRRSDRKDLASFVIAAGRAGGVGRQLGAALGAGAELAGAPAVGRFAGAQAHFGDFAFRDGHKKSAFGFELIQLIPSRLRTFLRSAAGGFQAMVGTAMAGHKITTRVVW